MEEFFKKKNKQGEDDIVITDDAMNFSEESSGQTSVVVDDKLTANDILRRVFLHIPFVLLVALALVLIGGGLLLIVYAITLITATSSGMMFNVLFGAGALAIGFGLLSIEGFIKYRAYYNEKEKFISRPAKTEIKKSPFSFSNICLYVLIIGSLFVIVSAFLGSINPDKWVSERSGYMLENGYYEETKTYEVKFDTTDTYQINKIVIDLDQKNVAVFYVDDVFITVKGYQKFAGAIETSLNKSDGIITITDGDSPAEDNALNKMLFFLFDDNEAEAQIRLYIPSSLKDNIEIKGDYVIAK